MAMGSAGSASSSSPAAAPCAFGQSSCSGAIQPGHRLVTDGVYAVIRHPSYLGLLISSLGWALVFRSAVGVVLAALMIPPLLARIRAEEKLLRSHFGAKYEIYSSRTARLVPGVF